MPRPKKRGRPATGRDPLVAVRMPEWLLKKIDEWDKYAASGAQRRSILIRRLVGAGLQTLPGEADDPKKVKKPRRKKSKPELTTAVPPQRTASRLPPRKIFLPNGR